MHDKRVADSCANLFQPDFLLPVQFFAVLKHQPQASGEQRLMVAILEDAIDCFQKYLWATDNRRRQLWREAEEWVLSDDKSWLFSFINICEALEVHPQFLRRGLMNWKDQQIAQRRLPAPPLETAQLLPAQQNSNRMLLCDALPEANET